MNAPEHGNQQHPGRGGDRAQEKKEPQALQSRGAIPQRVAVEVGASRIDPAPQLRVSVPLAWPVVVPHDLKFRISPGFAHSMLFTTRGAAREGTTEP